MSGDSSEEKKFPASDQKLRKAREKGQVVTSRETLASVGSIVGLAYLFFRRGAIAQQFDALMRLEVQPGTDFMPQLARQARAALDLGLMIALPMLVVVLGVGILVGMAISGGPLFSVQPLMPDFNKVNPASGLKKLFGAKAFKTFGMNILRCLALTLIVGLMLRGSIGALVGVPACGLECGLAASVALLRPVLGATIAALLVFALLDYMINRASFLKEQRMTLTEVKRESKDNMGDPHLRGQLRADREQMVRTPTGLSQAVVIIHDGTRRAMAVRYVEGDTPAPLVVARASGADSVMRMIRRGGVEAADDTALVRATAHVAVGDYITEEAAVMLLVPYLQRAAMA